MSSTVQAPFLQLKLFQGGGGPQLECISFFMLFRPHVAKAVCQSERERERDPYFDLSPHMWVRGTDT